MSAFCVEFHDPSCACHGASVCYYGSSVNVYVSASSAASVIRISLNMGSPMGFDTAHQTMLRTQPSFTVSQLSPGREGAAAEAAGELETAIGRVTSVGGYSFTVSDAVSGLATTYLTDRNTAYDGVSLRPMANLFVRIYSTTRGDGQLLAQEVSIAGSGSGQ